MKGRCGGKSIFLPAVLCGFLLVLGMMTACGMGGRERAAAGNSSVAIATSSGTGQDSGGTSGTSGLDAGQPALSVQAGSPANPYDIDPAPLTVADCARCHVFHFRHIRESGGGHRIDCRECHLEFHAYNPLRGNYAELMPKCGLCHSNPHAEKHAACLSCHEQPHAPRQIPFAEPFVSSCAECHRDQQGQLQQYPSAHSAQDCRACHPDRHGRILSCMECHEVHYESQPAADCTGCHPVHSPLQTVFTADATAATCRDCHGGIVQKLQATPSKHGLLGCAECHRTHRVAPACTECHSPPHGSSVLARFPECLACHLDAHDLPVK
jgi:hypothetical protein